MSRFAERVDTRIIPFALVLAFFVSTWPVVTGEDEMYPSIMMPGFQGSGGRSPTEFIVTRPRITAQFEDGEELPLTTVQLFGPIPSSHYVALLRGFRPDSISRAVKPIRETRLPGLALRRRRYSVGGQVLPTPETLRWFGDRVTEATGRTDARQIQVVWVRQRYRRADGELLASQSIGTFHLRLTP